MPVAGGEDIDIHLRQLTADQISTPAGKSRPRLRRKLELTLFLSPALLLFAIIVAYFVIGSKTGGTLWQRILRTR